MVTTVPFWTLEPAASLWLCTVPALSPATLTVQPAADSIWRAKSALLPLTSGTSVWLPGIGIGVKIDGGSAGHRCARVGVLVGDDGGSLVALALHELMLEALGIQGDLRIAPLLAHEVRHLDGVLAAVDAVGGNAQIGGYLTDDVADHRRSRMDE